MARRMRITVLCVEHDDWSCHGPRAGLGGWRSRAGQGSAVQYETVAEAYRGLERAGGRLALIDRLAVLLARTPAELLPVVCYLCQGLIAPQFAGVDLGLAEKLAVRAVATAHGAGPRQVAASVRETGDLGEAVTVVVGTLHRIAGSEGPVRRCASWICWPACRQSAPNR
jgi:DNA ligase N terminus